MKTLAPVVVFKQRSSKRVLPQRSLTHIFCVFVTELAQQRTQVVLEELLGQCLKAFAGRLIRTRRGGQEVIEDERQVTVLLVQYATPLAAASLPRKINTETNMNGLGVSGFETIKRNCAAPRPKYRTSM